jgi:hypothetical protein
MTRPARTGDAEAEADGNPPLAEAKHATVYSWHSADISYNLIVITEFFWETETMRKLLLVVALLLVLAVAGCEALTMTPDGWLDPHRWEQQEQAEARMSYSKATDQPGPGAQF